MTTDDSCVLVVRAWRDSGRLLIRVLAGGDHERSTDQWVFADTETACLLIAAVIDNLGTDSPCIQSVDAPAHPDPAQ